MTSKTKWFIKSSVKYQVNFFLKMFKAYVCETEYSYRREITKVFMMLSNLEG